MAVWKQHVNDGGESSGGPKLCVALWDKILIKNYRFFSSVQVSLVIPLYVDTYKRTKCRATQVHSATYRQTYYPIKKRNLSSLWQIEIETENCIVLYVQGYRDIFYKHYLPSKIEFACLSFIFLSTCLNRHITIRLYFCGQHLCWCEQALKFVDVPPWAQRTGRAQWQWWVRTLQHYVPE